MKWYQSIYSVFRMLWWIVYFGVFHPGKYNMSFVIETRKP